MMDAVPTIIGLAATRLREVFAPDASVPPLGGGTDTVYILAGDVVDPPPWVGTGSDSCDGCGPYVWVRLSRRWRTEVFPAEAAVAGCAKEGVSRAITIEAGIARCHPLTDDAEELEMLAAAQWDDSWRIDIALCAAMRDAINAGKISDSVLGPGDPFGPDGLVAGWLQTAHAELKGSQ